MRRIILEVEEKDDAVRAMLHVEAGANATQGEHILAEFLIAAIRLKIASTGPRAFGRGNTREEAEMAVDIDRDIQNAGEDKQP